jgi:ribonuclease HII
MNFKIGIDEAGRGPWAGPVFAGLVILSEAQENFLKTHGINDSKKLTAKKREELYKLILQNCIFAKVKHLPVIEIDKIGIYKSTKELIKLLAEEIDHIKLNLDFDSLKILIDGVFPKLELKNAVGLIRHECIIKGDAKEPAISAASILAKVRRDAYMKKLHEVFPDYQFHKHKGYGTKLHQELLEKFGPCLEHRKSFAPIKKFFTI